MGSFDRVYLAVGLPLHTRIAEIMIEHWSARVGYEDKEGSILRSVDEGPIQDITIGPQKSLIIIYPDGTREVYRDWFWYTIYSSDSYDEEVLESVDELNCCPA